MGGDTEDFANGIYFPDDETSDQLPIDGPEPITEATLSTYLCMNIFSRHPELTLEEKKMYASSTSLPAVRTLNQNQKLLT